MLCLLHVYLWNLISLECRLAPRVSTYVIVRAIVAVVVLIFTVGLGFLFCHFRQKRRREMEAARPAVLNARREQWHQYGQTGLPRENRYPQNLGKAVMSRKRFDHSTHVYELAANDLPPSYEFEGASEELDSREAPCAQAGSGHEVSNGKPQVEHEARAQPFSRYYPRHNDT